jgi:hypothetical protein
MAWTEKLCGWKFKELRFSEKFCGLLRNFNQIYVVVAAGVSAATALSH